MTDIDASVLGQPQTLSDARQLRALSHPVRLALLDALLTGPLTATQAGQIIGETPTTCSFHLRQLARYGFVAEAGRGAGRSRPWQLTHSGWSAPARPDNEEFTRASQELDRVLLNRHFERMRRFVDDQVRYPPAWRRAANISTSIVHVTAAELRALNAAQRELAEQFRQRWAERSRSPGQRPAGTRPVEIFSGAYPIDDAQGAKK